METLQRTGMVFGLTLAGAILPCQPAYAAEPPIVYQLISCRSPANDMCRNEAEFQQPRASGKCEAARRDYLAAHKNRSVVCLKKA